MISSRWLIIVKLLKPGSPPRIRRTASDFWKTLTSALFPTKSTRSIELGSVTLTVLTQPPENVEDENDNSIGIRVQHGSFSLLLTGDSQAGERAFWERHVPDLIRDCMVLKVGF
jgi:beta-lactamase superfamily II metal-dependent hydrolase